MRITGNTPGGLLIFGCLIYVLACAVLYVFQEELIFFPEKLSTDYEFRFDQTFEEVSVKTKDGLNLNGVLFKADTSEGLIFYLHGNAGSIRSWGTIASHYTDLGYDLFILDYRGYGKSEGTIQNEVTFFSDIQTAYDLLKPRYNGQRIVISGYSIGTGSAAWLASVNNPDLLILQAPYYSLTDMKDKLLPVIPDFVLKYKFETYQFLENVESPVIIFHGDRDEVISYQSSMKLQNHFKPGDVLITLRDQGHNGMSYNTAYRSELRQRLPTWVKKD